MKMTIDEIDTIIGIDQTGAKKGKNKAKKLPISVLRKVNHKWSFDEEQNYISSLDISNLSLISSSKGTLICIDTVLGLPKEYSKVENDIKSFIKRTKKYDQYGMDIAESFFNSFKISNFQLREIEKELGANSVFTTRPYQKNIQTGTFRVWKDLSKEIDNFNIWPNIKNFNKENYTLIEGYPSEAWKILNESKRFVNDLTTVKEKFKDVKNIYQIREKSKDHQDASLLSLLCLYRLKSGLSFRETSIEGDILK